MVNKDKGNYILKLYINFKIPINDHFILIEMINPVSMMQNETYLQNIKLKGALNTINKPWGIEKVKIKPSPSNSFNQKATAQLVSYYVSNQLHHNENSSSL